MKKTYKVSVYPDPYVYCVDSFSKEDARKMVRDKYGYVNEKIVVSTIYHKLIRDSYTKKERQIVNRMVKK